MFIDICITKPVHSSIFAFLTCIHSYLCISEPACSDIPCTCQPDECSGCVFPGLGTVIGGAAGTFFGGYMIKRLELRMTGIIQMCMITSGLAALGQLGILFRCPDVHLAGVSHHYNGTAR